MEFGDLLTAFLGLVGTLVKWGFQLIFALVGLALLAGVFAGPVRELTAAQRDPAQRSVKLRRALNVFALCLVGLAVWYAVYRVAFDSAGGL